MQASRQTASKIFGYDPKEAGLPIEKLNLLLCGCVGAGKSSIVSLIHSIITGRTSAIALHGTGTSSVTSDLTKYRFNQPGSTSKVQSLSNGSSGTQWGGDLMITKEESWHSSWMDIFPMAVIYGSVSPPRPPSTRSSHLWKKKSTACAW